MRGPSGNQEKRSSESEREWSPGVVGTLVIGSGVAGLRAAIEASRHGDVLVLGKSPQESTSTYSAQGGIAVAVDSKDSPLSHEVDTIAAGAGLCDEPVVRTMVREGLKRVEELIEWGMQFDRKDDGSLSLGLEAAHSFARVVHSDGDATGRELVRCLMSKAAECANLTFAEGWYAIDLVTETDGDVSRVFGVLVFHPDHGKRMIRANTTILATGGASDLFRESSNPGASTGDGIAMAYRAGASVSDMAFVQFHPTALRIDGRPRLLITEAVRGEGGHLLDVNGDRFMIGEHALAELAPRDVVSRAIAARMADSGERHVYLDVRHISGFSTRFPGISSVLENVGLDPGHDLIPVAPVAHFTIGGVTTDECGRTSVHGLYAIGEVSCTGFHGANRLASNSVLEGLVMGEAAARAAATDGTSSSVVTTEQSGLGRVDVAMGDGDRLANDVITSESTIESGKGGDTEAEEHGILVERQIAALRTLMWTHVGIERCEHDLRSAANQIMVWREELFCSNHPLGWKLRNMLLVADLITRSALYRKESRGTHWRRDARATALESHDVWFLGCDNPVLRPVVHLPQETAG